MQQTSSPKSQQQQTERPLETLLGLLTSRTPGVLEELKTTIHALRSENEKLRVEATEYKASYLVLLEANRKLELGLIGQKRERFKTNEAQNVFKEMFEALGLTAPHHRLEENGAAGAPPPPEKKEKKKRKAPTGKRPLPKDMPRIEVTVVPPEVEAQGTDNFIRIGVDTKESIEKRIGGFVSLTTHRVKFVPKNKAETYEGKPVLQADALPMPVPKADVGPALLAESIVERFGHHMPLYRLEKKYDEEGFFIARSTISGWHFAAAEVVKPLVDEMWREALLSQILLTDATGVRVLELQQCRNAHFFVVIQPEKHVLFSYAEKHNKETIDDILKDFNGYLVRDAHSIYLHFEEAEEITGVGCWSHVRRYVFKSLSTDPPRATWMLTQLQKLFAIERAIEKLRPAGKRARRQLDSKPLIEEFFAYCEKHIDLVVDSTPISKAIHYALNQRVILERFLEDGRLPFTNNASEGALRRLAVGRKNWLFLGSDAAGDVNATFSSLLASCEMHKVRPLRYLRDIFCLMAVWPKDELLQLAPAYWAETSKLPATQALLHQNPYWLATKDENF